VDETPQGRRGTENIEAYQACLEGRYYWTHRRSLEKAIAAFDRAVAIDPTYARAFAGIADVHSTLTGYGMIPPAAGVARARPAADRAVALDDELAEAHYAQFLIDTVFDSNLESAENQLKRALELDPRFGLARASLAWLRALRRANEPEVDGEAALALRLEPVSPLVSYQLALGYVAMRRSHRALELAARALDLDSTFVLGHWLSAVVLSYGLERHEEAVSAARRSVELSNRHPMFLACYGACMARAGDRRAAESALLELIERSRSAYVDPWGLTVLYLALGDLDHAIEQARRACDLREGFGLSVATAYWTDALSAHLPYGELLPRGWKDRPR
jgi:tetratricopeptide (TPR) repeat protein